MALNEVWTKQLNEDESIYIDPETGECVMILVSSIEVPDTIMPPNWTTLKSALLLSPELSHLLPQTMPQGFTVFTTYLTAGEINRADQKNFQMYFDFMGLTLTIEEKEAINAILTENYFSIQLT